MSHYEHATTPASAERGTSDALPDSQEYLTFCLGGEEYGIDILKVQEIRGYEQPTRMNGSPKFVKGVLNLRGVVVPIVDLRMKLAMPNPRYDALTVTVILALDHCVVGVVVDSVSDVVELTPEQIKRVPSFNGYVDSRCVTGIGTVHQHARERMLILLNAEKLFADGEKASAATQQNAAPGEPMAAKAGSPKVQAHEWAQEDTVPRQPAYRALAPV